MEMIDVNDIEVGDLIQYNDQNHVCVFTERDFTRKDYDTGMTRVYTVTENNFSESQLNHKEKAEGSIIISAITDICNDYRLGYRYNMIAKHKYPEKPIDPPDPEDELRWDFEDLEEGDDPDSNDYGNNDFGDIDGGTYPESVVIDKKDYNFGDLEEEEEKEEEEKHKEDEVSYNFGDIFVGDDTAVGDHNFDTIEPDATEDEHETIYKDETDVDFGEEEE